MSDFDLDLRAVEDHLDTETESQGENVGEIVLDFLDGSTPPEEWVDLIETGKILVLNVEGDVNERAAGFARDIKQAGGNLVHFRGFLIVTPPGYDVDTDRLHD